MVPNRLAPSACGRRLAAAGLLAAGLALAAAPAPEPPGEDLRLSYRSEVDDTDQPYRLYVPSTYDGSRAFPLVLALHGTGGTSDSLFEERRLPPGELRRVAERHGVLLATPHGRGTTEYRGVGENDVLRVLAEVRTRYRVDADRVYLTGQSMGGTGAAYLAFRHPQLFAAVAPLAPAYSYPWLAPNAAHVAQWWLQGGADAGFYLAGVGEGIRRMRELGQPVRYDIIPGGAHEAGLLRIDEVVGWLVGHRRVALPPEYTFAVDTPRHGHAYWTDVQALARPGELATVHAKAASPRRAELRLANVAVLHLLPDPALFDLREPWEVAVDGQTVFGGRVAPGEELRLEARDGRWLAQLRPAAPRDPTAYRRNPVATAPAALANQGVEAPLANWISDAMRSATGADLALYNRVHDRGRGLPAGTIDVVDLLQCSLPFDELLVTAQLTGRDLAAILEANVQAPAELAALPPERRHAADRLVQVSGLRYRFDAARPAGQRLLWTDLEPDRRYRVVLEGQVVQRETIRLAGRLGPRGHQLAPVSFSMALYGYARRLGRIEAAVEGRVVKAEAGPPSPSPR